MELGSARATRPRSVFESGNIMAAERVRPRRDDFFAIGTALTVPAGLGTIWA